jgi:hypothetical protein
MVFILNQVGIRCNRLGGGPDASIQRRTGHWLYRYVDGSAVCTGETSRIQAEFDDFKVGAKLGIEEGVPISKGAEVR